MPNTELEELRQQINAADCIIALEIKKRLKAAQKIGLYKKVHSLPIEDKEREKEVIENFTKIAGINGQPIIETIIQVCKKEE